MVVKDLVRQCVEQLSPYVCARDLYKKADIFMDANENSFGSVLENSGLPAAGIELNRYPDPDCTLLKNALANYCGVGSENIIVGNGSDEIISLAVNTFAEKGDSLISLVPGYSMYEIIGEIAGVDCILVETGDNFQPDLQKILQAKKENTKMLFFPSPNTPVGVQLSENKIRGILESFSGIVFLDEAYYEFYGKTSIGLLKEFDNLVISRTLSKAWGLANLRVGYAIASADAINAMRKIKLPYNVNGLTQQLAFKAVSNEKKSMEQKVELVKQERTRLIQSLKAFGLTVFPSVTNFVLFKLPKKFVSKEIQRQIAEKGIIVRDRSSLPLLGNCIRVTVGTPDENNSFLAALEEVLK